MSESDNINIWLDQNEAAKCKKLKPTLESLGCKVGVKRLPFDVLITGKDKTVAVERKDVLDFAQSIKFNRLWNQCSALSEFSPNAYLILEGWLMMIKKVSRIAENSILGMIDSVLDKYKVKIVPTPNMYWTALWIKRKAKEIGNPDVKKEYALRPTARPNMPDYVKALYVIEGILGASTAKAVLYNFESIENICSLLNDKEKFFTEVGNVKLASGRRIRDKDVGKLYIVLRAKYPRDKHNDKH